MPNKDSLNLGSPVLKLEGVGPKTAVKLRKIGINVTMDLLFHLPTRYQDRTKITPISSLSHGTEYLVEGILQSKQIVFRGRRNLICRVNDPSGSITLRFFHFSNSQLENLEVGRKIHCFGLTRKTPSGIEFIHPDYKVSAMFDDIPLAETLTPIYPLTEGIQQKKLGNLIRQAVRILENSASNECELLPEKIRKKFGLLDIAKAIRNIHCLLPNATIAVDKLVLPYVQRLAFEELLSQKIHLKRARKKNMDWKSCLAPATDLRNKFVKNLKFELTTSQQKVIQEIDQDLGKSMPMNRLLQGDVGSGKTVVAGAICSNVVASGYKVALMAPTELLAEQHHGSLKDWFDPIGIETFLITGKTTTHEHNDIVQRLTSENPLVIVGTHALFQDSIQYIKLGLTIIDEQHRFGVEQRNALLSKSRYDNFQAHQLVMTATPIPRTLAMTAYSHLDISILDAPPKGRKRIATHVMPESRRTEIVRRIGRTFRDGGQIYWVCPLIEKSEKLEKKAATLIAAELSKELPELDVGLIHGRLSEIEKYSVMQSFIKGKTNLLVATTVIEVGVNVPNATLIVIENSEHLGLSQLHQLRGRVGRSHLEANCILLYKSPLSESARARLEIIRNTNDGFEIAELDLKMRGPGEFLGNRQSGEISFKIADLVRDAKMIVEVDKAASSMIDVDDHTLDALCDRWMMGASILEKDLNRTSDD